jgi:hypothetical protein
MPYTKFDRDKLKTRRLADRKNKVYIERDHIPADRQPGNCTANFNKITGKCADRIMKARNLNRPVIMAFGAHTIKNGMAPALTALIKEGWITHLATNGAGIIHDWEFAYQGKSSEDVRENVNIGQFGIWEETGFYINLALIAGAYKGLGYGESVGKMIWEEGVEIPELPFLYEHAVEKMKTDPETAAAALDFAGIIQHFGLTPGFMEVPHPWKEYSVQGNAYKLKVPFTGHPMIGHDIIYNHPLNHGAAIGRTALNDFLGYAHSVSNLENGVYLSVGSAVMSPMIFEKALSMSQNLAIQRNEHIDNHYILVVDLAYSEWDWQKDGEPPADNPAYYLRYCKTFNRMGGEMDYLTADNRDFLLALYQLLKRKDP